MATFNYWTIVGPTMILASFVIGWLRNKKHFCVIENERYTDRPGLIFAVVGAPAFLILTIYESSAGCLQFWRDNLPTWLSRADDVAQWCSFAVVGALAYLILRSVHRFGYDCGYRYIKKATQDYRRKCANGIECAASCPRACKGCPNKGIIHVEDLIVDVEGESILRRSSDPKKSLALAYCTRVYNSNTHQYMFVTRHRERGAKYNHFVPMPMRNHYASEFRPATRRNNSATIPFDYEAPHAATSENGMPPFRKESKRSTVVVAEQAPNGAARMIAFSGREDSDLMQRVGARFTGSNATVYVEGQPSCD